MFRSIRVTPCLLALLPLAIAQERPAPPFYPDKSKLLIYRGTDGKEYPVKSKQDWEIRRRHIVGNMELVMGPLPPDNAKVPLKVKYLEEKETPKYTLKKLTFAVAKGDRVPAFLLVPRQRQGKVAAVLCLHQTNGKLGKSEPAGLGGHPNLHYAHHLAELGFVTLAPDYPSFGEYDFDFSKSNYVSGSMKAIWNNRCAVDLLQGLPEVDGERIGVIGHSLGGHNAMFTAVFEPRLKVIVSNCGFCSFYKYYKGNLKGWTSVRYMPRIASVYENKPEKMPFDFTEVVASFAPRAFLASSPIHDGNFAVDGVKDCLRAAQAVYELFGVPERLAANYPPCGHDFPEDVRRVAYDFLQRWLK